MKNFTRRYWEKGMGVGVLQNVRNTSACLRLTKTIIVKASVCLMVFFTSFDLDAQITYDWLGGAPDGNFAQGAAGARWNPGGLFDEPPFGIVQFNNNNQVIMTNNVAGTWSQYRINFGASATTSRTIGGNTIQFFDFSGFVPAIINSSAATHSINFPILNANASGANRLEINATNGNFIIGSTIGPSGTPRTLVGMGASNISFNGVISGVMNFVKEGGGTTTFTAANTYTGTTSVAGGILSLSGSGTYGSNTRVIVNNGATLNLNNVSASVQSVEETANANGGVVSLGTGTLTVLGGFTGPRFQNSISGTGGLVKQGTGTMSLYGSQSYTGTTTIGGGELSSGVAMSSISYLINGGTFRLAAANILPDASNVTMTSGTFAVDNNETINNLNISGGGTLTVASNVTLTINGIFTGGLGNITNNGTIIFASGGTATTFPGSGTVTMNNLTLNNSSGVSLSNPIVISGTLAIGSGIIFRLNGNAGSAATVTAGNSSSIINNGHASTAATFTFNNSGDYTFGGTLANGSTGVLNVTKSGAGNLTLSIVLNTYTGITTISAGTLTATAPASLPTSGNISIGNATLALGSGFTVGATKTLGTLQLTATSNLNVGGTAGAFELTFANSKSSSWIGTFNVQNWTPSASKNIYFLSTGLTSVASGQLDNFNFDNYGIGSKFDASTANKVIPKFLYITNGTGGGLFSLSTSWQNGDNPNLNTGVASIYIRPGDLLTQDIAYNLLSVNVGGTYNVGAVTINITGSPTPGFITNTGIINMIASSIINMQSTSPINNAGTINMAANSVINMGASSTFSNSGTIATVAGSAINFNALGGLFTNSGSPVYSGSGAINFLGAGTISGTATLGNISIAGLVDFGTGSTIGAGSSLSINAGGAVSSAATAPFYAAGSRLVYRRGGGPAIAYDRFNEWCAAAGRGFPDSVLITNNTKLNLATGLGTVRKMGGSLTIDAGSEVTMVGMTDSLAVVNNVIVNGILRLGSSIGSDLRLGGDYYQGPAPAYTFNNDRAVWFINPFKDQFVSKLGGGDFDFDFIVVDKSATTQLKMTAGTNAYIQTDNTSSLLRILQLLNGNIDMNGGILTVEGNATNSMNIAVGGGSIRKIYTSTGSGEFRIRGSNAPGVAKLNVIALSAGSNLLFDNNVLVSTTVGCDFGAAGITTINAILRIDQFGYIIYHSPNYGTSSTLIYNNGSGGYKRNTEWNANSFGTLGTGFPNNIIVQNSTPLQLNSTDFPAAPALGCSGNFIINTGSSVITTDMANPLSVNGNLTIAGTLTLSTNAAGVLNVGGNWARTGTFVQNDRNVNFNGIGDGILTATSGQTFSFMTLNKTGTGRLTISENVAITDTIGLKSGNLTLSNKGISIISTASKTARVGVSSMLMADITYTSGSGKFFVQRYIPAKRSWRLLSAPFNPNPSIGIHSISEAWQERSTGLNYTAAQFAASISADTISTGFSTHITGGSILNGFDSSPTNYTGIRFYNSGTWLTPGNVNGTSVNSREGWMLFVRGDRKTYGEITTQIKAATVTTLRPRGEIFLGNKVINTSGMTVVGNPYASAVDYTTLTKTGALAGTNTYTMWDPNVAGANGVGAFVTLTSFNGSKFLRTIPSSNGTILYPGSSIDDRYIPSGAAIMVDFAGGGTLTFKESDKVSANTTAAFRPVSPVSPVKSSILQTVLETVENDTSSFVSDGNLVLFGNDFSNEFDGGDARKVFNFSENFGMRRDGKVLSIERKNFLTGNDTIFYNLQNMRLRNYRLQLNMENVEPAQGTAAFFEDLYLRKKHPVNLNSKYSYNFKVSNDSGSFAPNRFRLVFKPSVQYTFIEAKISTDDNLIEWKVAEEFNLEQYEVERSLDGVNFTAIGTIICGDDNTKAMQYSWTDEARNAGKYFYRIKSTSNNKVVAYSEIVKLTRIKGSPAMFIFPNPITSNTINIQMNKMPVGMYGFKLMNAAGQVLMNQTINHAAGVATYTVKPDIQLAKGLYKVEITNAQKKSTVLTALIQ